MHDGRPDPRVGHVRRPEGGRPPLAGRRHVPAVVVALHLRLTAARACSPSPRPSWCRAAARTARTSPTRRTATTSCRSRRSSPTTSGSSPRSAARRASTRKAGKDDDGKPEWRTRLVDDACIFLNRPGLRRRPRLRAAHARDAHRRSTTATSSPRCAGSSRCAAIDEEQDDGTRHLDAHRVRPRRLGRGRRGVRVVVHRGARGVRRRASPCTGASSPSSARCSATSCTSRSSTYLDERVDAAARRPCVHPAERAGRSVGPTPAELAELRRATSRRRRTSTAPVIHDDASDARNSAAPAMSSGSPMRRSGWRARDRLLVGLPQRAGDVASSRGPARARSTRTSGASSSASWRGQVERARPSTRCRSR